MSIVTEDAVVLTLFQKGDLDFVRHLPVLYIRQYQDSPEFHKVPQFRFDFFGFGPALDAFPDLRKALSESLAYDEMQQLFSAAPRPGCPGIPAEMYAPPVCVNENLEDAKASLAKLKTQMTKTQTSLPALRLVYSKAGGEDHDRTTQWIQDQWRQKLGLEIVLQQLENKTFLHEITTNPPPLFRRGLSPDRPTCLAVLENFSKDGGENAFHINEPELETTIIKLRENVSASIAQKLCHRGLSLLIDQHHLIPTGPLYFSILVQKQWTGWRLNNLNQLDLADLRSVSATH
jgi:oligopeptide transport system substrate-binding protein